MNEERETGFAELHRARQPLRGREAGLLERLLAVNLGAGAVEAGHAGRGDFRRNPVAVPSGREILRPHIAIVAVVSVNVGAGF